MSRVFVLFVLFIVSIAVQFGDCQNNRPECEDVNIKPGSDPARLSYLEVFLKGVSAPSDWLNKLLGRNKKNSFEGGSYSTVLDKYEKEVHAVFPGTVWCGDGNKAKTEDDLGFLKQTDACCREHDNCAHNILAGEPEGNLLNNGIFTKSACVCDYKFYDCLKNVNGFWAFNIGKTYFNVLGPQCFRCACPTEGCKPGDGTECKNHCKKYEWVDSRKY
ncbi:PREDICTED: phospholipase A2-like [Wasmannia auropunctata]|uniref:phospholipase A2-like n=1 Tax=Wasmannia auropunctata TaxID=64793 RepID=UPI0005EDEFBF|nr:PREDICTED: phospholipase A2-like [Wasmannia auropunctata]